MINFLFGNCYQKVGEHDLGRVSACALPGTRLLFVERSEVAVVGLKGILMKCY